MGAMSRLVLLALVLLFGGCAGLGTGRAPDVAITGLPNSGRIVAFNASATVLAGGDSGGRLYLWALPDGKLLHAWQGHGEAVNGIVFDHGDLITAGYDRRLVRWNTRGKLLDAVTTPSPITAMVVDSVHGRVITGHADGDVRVWRLSDFSLERTYGLHAGELRAVAVDPVHGWIGASDDHSQVFLLRDGKVQLLAKAPGDTWSLVFSPDGAVLIGGGWFDLYRWHLPDGRLTVLDTPHHGIVKSLAFSANGRELASISRQTDSAVYLLDPHTGHPLTEFESHDLCGAWVALSHDGRYLATTSDDASVHIWDLPGTGTMRKQHP